MEPWHSARTAPCRTSISTWLSGRVAALAGDIDKLLGDGGVGIGLYDGAVIATVIGSSERKDFTVIGDAVNISARLCEIAAEGEIVAENAVVEDVPEAAGAFGPVEEVSVKGRRSRVRIRRWTLEKSQKANLDR